MSESDSPFTGRYTNESEHIQISGIEAVGGWRTGRRSPPQRADRLEELEGNMWSVG